MGLSSYFGQQSIVRTSHRQSDAGISARTGKKSLVNVKGTREVVATFGRWTKFIKKGVARETERSSVEIRDLARAEVYVDDGVLRRSIRVRRGKSEKFGAKTISAGVKVYAKYGVVEEGGRKGRTGRPFFYKQIDIVGPKFDKRVQKIVAVDAMRKARPNVR